MRTMEAVIFFVRMLETCRRDWSDRGGVSNARDKHAEGTSPSVCAQALDDDADAIGCGTVPRASGSPAKATNAFDGDWDYEKIARGGIEIFSVSESEEKPGVRSFRATDHLVVFDGGAPLHFGWVRGEDESDIKAAWIARALAATFFGRLRRDYIVIAFVIVERFTDRIDRNVEFHGRHFRRPVICLERVDELADGYPATV